MLKARPLMTTVLCATLLLSACSKATEPQKKTGPQPEAPPLITLTLFSGGFRETEAAAAAYQTAHPNVRINVIKGSEFGEKLSQVRAEKMKAGEIDVVFARKFTDVSDGLLLPLDSYIQKSNLDLKPFGGWLEQWRHEGRLYYLPMQANPTVILYNKELFKAAGVPEPIPDWTWEQFRETAGRVTSGSGEQRVWGFNPAEPHLVVQLWLEGETGKPWWQADEKTITRALQLFTTMMQTDRSLAPVPAVDWANPSRHRDAVFQERKAAMVSEEGNLFTLYWTRAGFPVGMVSFPTAPGGKPLIPVDPFAFGIAANSKQPDAAWDLLQFMVGPEGAKYNAANAVMPMYVTEEVEKAWFSREPRPGKDTEILFRAERVYPPTFMSPPFRLDMAFDEMTNRVLSGSTSLEVALAEYMKRQQKVLSEGKVKP